MSINTLNDLLSLAIDHEISSQKFYSESISKSNDPNVQHFLESLVEEEIGHERLLRSIQEMEIYDGSVAVDEKMLSSAQGSHSIDIPELKENPSIEDIYEIALKRETRAHRLFMSLVSVAENEELKQLFKNLADEEMNHHKSIETSYQAKTGQLGFEG